MYQKILIRYGELTTKGDNRFAFVKQLKRNAIEISGLKPEVIYDRMYLDYSDENIQKLSSLLGISSFSPVVECETQYTSIEEKVIEYVKWLVANASTKINTFCISSRRNWKKFELNSNEINIKIGAKIAEMFNFKVQMTKPDLKICIEIREKLTHIFSKKIRTWGGYPVGINGKVLMMLSGGIDSPVASFELMKRGLHVDFLSFVSPPLTDEVTVDKIKTIIKQLNKFQGKSKLYLYNYTNLLHTIEFASRQSYRITLMRRSFYRIATQIAKDEGYQAIANGENIGQVASQTLESMAVIETQTNLPVFRPLLTYNKDDTIKLAEQIGTFLISIIPAKESCEIFAPKKPIIKPTIELAEKLESEIPELIELEKTQLASIEKFKIE